MRLLRNRVVDEWTDRLAEVPTVRDGLPVIFLGQETEMRKFNVLLPTADTDGDWEEMPWLAGPFRGTDVRIRLPPPANRVRTRFPKRCSRRSRQQARHSAVLCGVPC
jgi:hypothetical protein